MITYKNIKFVSEISVEKSFYPEPASKNIPDWYKKTNSFMGSNKFMPNNSQGNQTIKKCVPVFDSLMAGYILKTSVDVYVSLLDNNTSYFHWPSNDAISFHPIEQAPLLPQNNGKPYPKWNNPWSIETPRGYSCLFLPPMNNPNKIFTILPAIVDTDKYIAPVAFPFTLDDSNFEGMIPAGTAICQVIPFKRDNFFMSINEKNQSKKLFEFNQLFRNRWINNYKSRFWSKKIYK